MINKTVLFKIDKTILKISVSYHLDNTFLTVISGIFGLTPYTLNSFIKMVYNFNVDNSNEDFSLKYLKYMITKIMPISLKLKYTKVVFAKQKDNKP